MGIKNGDKVKHINTGDYIYTVKSLTDNKIATIERPKELWVLLNPNSKSSPVIKVSVCKIENLIKI